MSLTDTAIDISPFSVRITWQHLLIALAVLALHYILFEVILEPKPRIRICRAIVQAVRTGLEQYGKTLKLLLGEILLLLISLTPLLVLSPLLVKKVPDLWYLAFFAYPLMLLVTFPVRVNAAACMQNSLYGGSVFSHQLMDFSGMRDKAVCGFKRMLLLPLWTLPTIIVLNYGYRLWKGEDDMDVITLLQSLNTFGGGDVGRVILYFLLIAAGLILFMMIGAAHHSGARHALALGNPKLVKGHHGKLVLGWLCATFIFLLPFWIGLAIVLVPIIRVLLTDRNSIVLHTANLPSWRTMLLIIGAGGLLSVPLLPFRSLVIAAMVHQLKENEEKAAP